MDTIKKYYFYAFSILPFLQLISQELFHKNIVNLFGFVGLLIFLFLLLKGDRLYYPKYLMPLVLLVLYYFVWDIVNGDIGEVGYFKYLYRNSWLFSIVILVLIENTTFDQGFIDNLIYIFKGTIIIAFVVVVIQLVYNPFFLMPDLLKLDFLSRTQYEIRLQSIFGHIGPNEVGFSLIPIVSILIGYYLMKNQQLSVIWLIMAGLVFFGTKTRFIYLNYIIILIQYPIVNGMNMRKTLRIFFLGFVSLILLFFVLKSIGFDVGEFIENRLLSESASTRLLAVEMFKDFFPNNPFFGTGIHVGEDLSRAIGGRSSQMHVGYLSHLYEFGIVGTILLMYFLVLTLRKFYYDSKETFFYGSLFAFITVFVTNLTLVHFSIFNYGLLFAFVFNKFLNDKLYTENIS